MPKSYENCTSVKIKRQDESDNEVFKFKHKLELKIETKFEDVKTRNILWDSLNFCLRTFIKNTLKILKNSVMIISNILNF